MPPTQRTTLSAPADVCLLLTDRWQTVRQSPIQDSMQSQRYLHHHQDERQQTAEVGFPVATRTSSSH